MAEEKLPGLVIDVEARITKLERSLQKANDAQKKAARQMEDRARDSARKIGDAYAGAGDGAARGFARMGEAMNRNRGAIQNFSYQAQDVAVQLANGTSAATAFGQQLPQLLSGFGVFGAVAGVAAGALIPLIANLMKTEEEASTLEDAFKSHTDATGRWKDALAAAMVPLSELRAEFGGFADEMAAAADTSLEVATGMGNFAALKLGMKMAQEFGGVGNRWPIQPGMGMLGRQSRDSERGGGDGTELPGGISPHDEAVDKIAKKYGIAKRHARELADAIDELQNTLDPEKQVAALQKMMDVMRESYNFDKNAVAIVYGDLWTQIETAHREAAARTVDVDEATARKLTESYDKTTSELAKLAEDRASAEEQHTNAVSARREATVELNEATVELNKAIAGGDQAAIEQAEKVVAEKKKAAEAARETIHVMTGVIRTINEQIDKVEELGLKGSRAYRMIAEAAGKVPAMIDAGAGRLAGPGALSVAKQYDGLHEDRNNEELRKLLPVDPANVAWCAAFVSATLAKIGVEGTGSLAARSYMDWGTGVETPAYGDVVVLKRGNNSAQGHVGFFEGMTADGGIQVYGGNQGDKVGSSTFRQEDVLGYRRAPAPTGFVDPAVARDEARIGIDAAASERSSEALKRDAADRKAAADAATAYGLSLLRAGDAANAEAAAVGKSAGEIARAKFEHDAYADAKAKGIDLTQKMVGSEMTYQQAIQQSGAAIEANINAQERAQQAAKTTAEAMQAAAEASQTGTNALADLFMAGIEGADSFGNALRNLAMTILRNQALQLLAGMPGMGFLGGLLGGGGMGFSVVGGFGDPLANALRGTGAFFAEGGFTGSGGKYEPAGVVHKGEYVLSAKAVRNLGVENIESLHKAALAGPGFAEGGLVGGTSKLAKATKAQAAGSPSVNIRGGDIIVNAAAGSNPEMNADLARQVGLEQEKAMRNLMQDQLLREMRPGGMLAGAR